MNNKFERANYFFKTGSIEDYLAYKYIKDDMKNERMNNMKNMQNK